MNASQRPVPDLSGLRDRLRSGIYPVMQRSRAASSAGRDGDALAEPWPESYREALARLRDDPWQDPDAPARAVSDLSQRLRGRRPLLIATLLNPVAVLDHIESRAPRPGTAVVDSWAGMYWLAQAAWDAAGAGLPAGAGFAPGETDLLRPLAARLRFLIGSEPMRARAQRHAWWTRGESDFEYSYSGLLARTLGDDSWHQFAGACREARRAWLDCLNGYQSHAYLSQASPAQLEEELSAVVFRSARYGQPLAISQVWLADTAPLDAADRAVIDEIAERHLLPRFDLRSAAALALHDNSKGGRIARRALAAAALAAGLGAAGCAAALLIHQATWVASGCYLLIAAGVVAFGPSWAAPWLLRLPAAAAIGIIALITFLPAGWLSTPLGGSIAATALAAAAFGYLVVEVRNHGVARAALLRAAAVAVIGAVQALMVTLIGMVAIAPAFAQHARAFAGLWDRPGYGHAGMVLLLGTTWCLAVGVFSQILWDDRPITAPLAHVSWRSR